MSSKKIVFLCLPALFLGLLLLPPLAFTKVHSSNVSVQKALAENAVFRCSAKNAAASDKKNKALILELSKKCEKEIKALGTWYKPTQQKERAAQLILNGTQSAFNRLSH